jgi:hypothetical protein
LITGFPATTAERQGDFSASARAIIDPVTGQPFPGNIIPANRIDPLARNMLTEYAPLPNQPNGDLQHLRSVPIDGRQMVAKVDYQFTVGDRVSYRFFRNKYQNTAQGGGTSDRLAGLADDITTSHSANYSRVFGPTLLNDLRVSYSMWDRRNVPPPGLANPQDLGANFIANPGAAPRPPNVTVTGRMSFLPPLELITPDRFFQVDNKLVWSRSRHDVTAGFRFMRNRHGDTAYQWTSGNFRFSGAFTGNAMADFLIGRPSSYAHFSTIIDDGYTYEFHSFVSDDFKISPNVTLNLGVRYSIDTPWVQIGDRTSMFRLDQINQKSTRFPDAPPGMVFAGDPGIPRGLYPTDKNNVAPRLGVVWDPVGNGRTAIRAGYGVFYANLSEGMSAYSTNNAPFILPVSFVPPSFSDPYRGRENPFPYDFEKKPRFVYPFETIGAGSDLQTGYIHQYNVTLQQQLGRDYVTTIGYVGSLGRKLQNQYDMNTAVYRPGATVANAQERRPIFPQYYAGIGVFTSDGSSQYDSLQLEFQKRLSRGHTFQLAYTLSKCTTDVAMAGLFAGGSYLQDPNDRLEGNEGPCAADQRHIFAFNGSWDIPAPQNKGVLSRILERWALAGTVRLTSGLRINVTSGCDCALIGADGGQLVGAQRPNQIGNPELPTDRSREERVAQYFNTTVFALPGPGQFGNTPRHSLVGPGVAQTDLALSRRFQAGLGAVQFRAEIFNLFNRVNFLNPNDPFTSPGFGRLVAARDPRIVQFGLKYQF